jgi:hypothetical protein
MANSLLSPTMITREAQRILHQKLRFIGSINRQYDDRFAKSGAKIGTALQIRMPNEFLVRTGKTLNAQDVAESTITLNVTDQAGVDMNFSSAELTLTIDDFSKRYIEPAMTRLAAHLEAEALSMYKDIYEEISDDGDTISLADVLEGAKLLTDNLCPEDGRTLLLNTRDNVSLVNALNTVFNPAGNISSQFRNGRVANNFVGYEDVFQSSQMPTHATGTETANTWRTDIAAGEANGSATYPEAGGSLHIDTGTTTFLKGDIIEIEGVFDVHPETKATRSRLKRFVVTADYTVGAEGDLQIYPGIVATGPKKNVSAAAVDGKIIYKRESDASTAIGASATYDISMGYHRDAFTFVTADLELPKGVDMAAREVFENISMRLVRQYDINNDNMPCRLDVYYGKKTIRPQLAVRYGH